MTSERRSQSITVSAKTVAEAIGEAERRLGLAQDELDITVLSEGSKGFLGIGGENARILAMPKAILARRTAEPQARASQHLPAALVTLPEPLAITVPAPVPLPALERDISSAVPPAIPVDTDEVARHEPLSRPTDVLPSAADAAVDPADDDEDDGSHPVRVDSLLVAEVAVEVVRELLIRMGLDAQATIRSTGNPVVIDIAGDELGLLIGRHGDTLGSLQYLVNAIVGKRVHRWCKVIVDVEHYRQRREDTLRTLANRQATRVRQSMREIALDPMPAAERRVVHMTLQNSPWVVTSSVGDEPNRHVVIAPRQGAR